MRKKDKKPLGHSYQRTYQQRLKDTVTFPFRAFTLFEVDKYGLSSLRTERFDYVAKEVKGYCLDIGCGKHNVFVKDYLNNQGVGIDVFAYEGLTKAQVVKDLKIFPFKDSTFQSITFIANINHIPREDRDKELKEAYRCLKVGGNIIVTMGNPLAELLVHKVVHLYDKLFKTNFDMDSERGMHEHEDYYLTDKEILRRLRKAGFLQIKKRSFWTQWGLNHMFIGWKTS